MQDTAKYLIHADITADGVVERSDVVGAIFGQTEGLLGDDLDLRDLQDSSKVGRIDVDVDSEHGQSYGEITIATSLDKVETAILAAALETIDRVGPCESTIDVESVEDVRAAKRREVVERAKQLLAESFDGSMLSSQELVDEVRRSIRIEDVTEYEGLPAGPRVADSDAIIVVEGRADVLQLLAYGVKNAVAVEGTNVPDAVADLTRDRTVTAFLDGDRGGDLILKELAQVGDVDYVAFAPPDRSVEDLDRHEVMAALREKVPYETVVDAETPREAVTPTEEGAAADDPTESTGEDATGPSTPRGETAIESVTEAVDEEVASAADGRAADGGAAADRTVPAGESAAVPGESPSSAGGDETGPATGTPAGDAGDATGGADGSTEEPQTLRGHVEAVVAAGSGEVRLLSAEYETLATDDAAAAFDLVRDAEVVPAAVVLDGEVSQRLLDVAAQRGVDQVVAASEGEFVKKPTGVRVRTADELLQVADQ